MVKKIENPRLGGKKGKPKIRGQNEVRLEGERATKEEKMIKG